MSRVSKTFALILAAALTIAGAAVQGHYAGRWTDANELGEAAAKLSGVPENFGLWHVVEEEPFAKRVADMLHCAGYIHRTYANNESHQQVEVAVIVGPSGPTSVHIPEICYSSRDYLVEGQRTHVSVLAQTEVGGQFWGVTLRAMNPSVGLTRVLYGWNGEGRWEAPEEPRLSMRSYRALYKIQLAATLPVGADPRVHDPCAEFLRDFLPILHARMAAVDAAITADESTTATE